MNWIIAAIKTPSIQQVLETGIFIIIYRGFYSLVSSDNYYTLNVQIKVHQLQQILLNHRGIYMSHVASWSKLLQPIDYVIYTFSYHRGIMLIVLVPENILATAYIT